MKKIMLLDDEENILSSVRRLLRKRSDWLMDCFSDPEEALNKAKKSSYDVFISDYRMPKMNGCAFLKETMIYHHDAIRIVLSGDSDIEAVINLINEAQIYRFLCKPVNQYELETAIEQGLQQQWLAQENARLACMVRRQQGDLQGQRELLERLSEKYPELTELKKK